MSRPDHHAIAEPDEPRLPRAQRTVHRRSAPVPLRVVSQRVRLDETDDRSATVTTSTPPPPADPAPVPTAVAGTPATGAVATLQQAPLPSPDVVGLPVRRPDHAPVLARRRPIAGLLALVRVRRRAVAGRHRPDTLPSRGWSMFAPHRRARRRFGGRRWSSR